MSYPDFPAAHEREAAEASLRLRGVRPLDLVSVIDFVTRLEGRIELQGFHRATVILPVDGGRSTASLDQRRTVQSAYSNGGSPEHVGARAWRNLVEAWVYVMRQAEQAAPEAHIDRLLHSTCR